MNGEMTSAPRRIAEGFGISVLLIAVVAVGVKFGWDRPLGILLLPAYLSSWITGIWGGHGSEVYFLPVSALMAGILWVTLGRIGSTALRISAFVTLFAVMAGLGSASFQSHQRTVHKMMQDRELKERESLSSLKFEKAGNWQGTEGLQLLYALIKNPDLSAPAIPSLRKFIAEDEDRWTDKRRLAAQIIFKATGERVPYDGLDKDKEIYTDPYDPKTSRRK